MQLDKIKKLDFIMRFLVLIYILSTSFLAINVIQARSLERSGENKLICNVITTNKSLDTYLWLVQELVRYLMWQYPIIYVFWPKSNVTKPVIHQTDNSMMTTGRTSYSQVDSMVQSMVSESSNNEPRVFDSLIGQNIMVNHQN